MAKSKSFISFEEAAQKLGVTEDEINSLVQEGKLKQYRDRDQPLVKASDVDALGGGDATATGDVVEIGDDLDNADEMADTGDISLDESTALSVGGNDDSGGLELTPEQNFSTGDTGGLELADDIEDGGLSLVDDGPGDGMNDSDTSLETIGRSPTDQMQIDDDEPPATRSEGGDTRQATGISVFDADELDDIADPMAQTQTTTDSGSVDDEDLALESVGSGSGLLDLTRESDDTSLGAELLDEIYPGEDSDGSGIGSGAGHDTFDPTSLEMSETSAGDYDGIPSSSGLENITSEPDDVPLSGSGLQSEFGTLEAGTPVSAGAAIPIAASEAYDPAGNALTAAMFIVATVALIMGMVIALSAISGAPNELQNWMSANDGQNLMIAGGAMAAAAAVLGLIGFVVGKKFE